MRFELPADLTKSLTDASHTAVGFATLAAKRANDARLDANARFEPQVLEARQRALTVVETLETARVRVETTVEPLVERAVERLPENVQDAVGEYRRMGKELAARAHDGAVRAIEFATAVPVTAAPKAATTAAPKSAKARRTPKATKAPKATASKTAPKAAAKSVAKSAAKPKAARSTTRRPRTTAAA